MSDQDEDSDTLRSIHVTPPVSRLSVLHDTDRLQTVTDLTSVATLTDTSPQISVLSKDLHVGALHGWQGSRGETHSPTVDSGWSNLPNLIFRRRSMWLQGQQARHEGQRSDRDQGGGATAWGESPDETVTHPTESTDTGPTEQTPVTSTRGRETQERERKTRPVSQPSTPEEKQESTGRPRFATQFRTVPAIRYLRRPRPDQTLEGDDRRERDTPEGRTQPRSERESEIEQPQSVTPPLQPHATHTREPDERPGSSPAPVVADRDLSLDTVHVPQTVLTTVRQGGQSTGKAGTHRGQAPSQETASRSPAQVASRAPLTVVHRTERDSCESQPVETKQLPGADAGKEEDRVSAESKPTIPSRTKETREPTPESTDGPTQPSDVEASSPTDLDPAFGPGTEPVPGTELESTASLRTAHRDVPRERQRQPVERSQTATEIVAPAPTVLTPPRPAKDTDRTTPDTTGHRQIVPNTTVRSPPVEASGPSLVPSREWRPPTVELPPGGEGFETREQRPQRGETAPDSASVVPPQSTPSLIPRQTVPATSSRDQGNVGLSKSEGTSGATRASTAAGSTTEHEGQADSERQSRETSTTAGYTPRGNFDPTEGRISSPRYSRQYKTASDVEWTDHQTGQTSHGTAESGTRTTSVETVTREAKSETDTPGTTVTTAASPTILRPFRPADRQMRVDTGTGANTIVKRRQDRHATGERTATAEPAASSSLVSTRPDLTRLATEGQPTPTHGPVAGERPASEVSKSVNESSETPSIRDARRSVPVLQPLQPGPIGTETAGQTDSPRPAESRHDTRIERSQPSTYESSERIVPAEDESPERVSQARPSTPTRVSRPEQRQATQLSSPPSPQGVSKHDTMTESTRGSHPLARTTDARASGVEPSSPGSGIRTTTPEARSETGAQPTVVEPSTPATTVEPSTLETTTPAAASPAILRPFRPVARPVRADTGTDASRTTHQQQIPHSTGEQIVARGRSASPTSVRGRPTLTQLATGRQLTPTHHPPRDKSSKGSERSSVGPASETPTGSVSISQSFPVLQPLKPEPIPKAGVDESDAPGPKGNRRVSRAEPSPADDAHELTAQVVPEPERPGSTPQSTKIETTQPSTSPSSVVVAEPDTPAEPTPRTVDDTPVSTFDPRESRRSPRRYSRQNDSHPSVATSETDIPGVSVEPNTQATSVEATTPSTRTKPIIHRTGSETVSSATSGEPKTIGATGPAAASPAILNPFRPADRPVTRKTLAAPSTVVRQRGQPRSGAREQTDVEEPSESSASMRDTVGFTPVRTFDPTEGRTPTRRCSRQNEQPGLTWLSLGGQSTSAQRPPTGEPSTGSGPATHEVNPEASTGPADTGRSVPVLQPLQPAPIGIADAGETDSFRSGRDQHVFRAGPSSPPDREYGSEYEWAPEVLQTRQITSTSQSQPRQTEQTEATQPSQPDKIERTQDLPRSVSDPDPDVSASTTRREGQPVQERELPVRQEPESGSPTLEGTDPATAARPAATSLTVLSPFGPTEGPSITETGTGTVQRTVSDVEPATPVLEPLVPAVSRGQITPAEEPSGNERGSPSWETPEVRSRVSSQPGPGQTTPALTPRRRMHTADGTPEEGPGRGLPGEFVDEPSRRESSPDRQRLSPSQPSGPTTISDAQTERTQGRSRPHPSHPSRSGLASRKEKLTGASDQSGQTARLDPTILTALSPTQPTAGAHATRYDSDVSEQVSVGSETRLSVRQLATVPEQTRRPTTTSDQAKHPSSTETRTRHEHAETPSGDREMSQQAPTREGSLVSQMPRLRTRAVTGTESRHEPGWRADAGGESPPTTASQSSTDVGKLDARSRPPTGSRDFGDSDLSSAATSDIPLTVVEPDTGPESGIRTDAVSDPDRTRSPTVATDREQTQPSLQVLGEPDPTVSAPGDGRGIESMTTVVETELETHLEESEDSSGEKDLSYGNQSTTHVRGEEGIDMPALTLHAGGTDQSSARHGGTDGASQPSASGTGTATRSRGRAQQRQDEKRGQRTTERNEITTQRASRTTTSREQRADAGTSRSDGRRNQSMGRQDPVPREFSMDRRAPRVEAGREQSTRDSTHRRRSSGSRHDESGAGYDSGVAEFERSISRDSRDQERSLLDMNPDFERLYRRLERKEQRERERRGL